MSNKSQAFAAFIGRALEAAERTVDPLPANGELPGLQAEGQQRSHCTGLEKLVDLRRRAASGRGVEEPE